MKDVHVHPVGDVRRQDVVQGFEGCGDAEEENEGQAVGVRAQDADQLLHDVHVELLEVGQHDDDGGLHFRRSVAVIEPGFQDGQRQLVFLELVRRLVVLIDDSIDERLDGGLHRWAISGLKDDDGGRAVVGDLLRERHELLEVIRLVHAGEQNCGLEVAGVIEVDVVDEGEKTGENSFVADRLEILRKWES